jgi:antitoxin VapB
MGTQLNIKSDDAYALATRLAEMTGESLTTAVTVALRERLEREERQRARKARADRLLAIAADIRAQMSPPLPSSDHRWLYDENGLPR